MVPAAVADGENASDAAAVIALRGQTGAQQTWYIDVAPTARPGTRPYRVGTYEVRLDELSASDLAGVRALNAQFLSPLERHDGKKRIRAGFRWRHGDGRRCARIAVPEAQ